MATIAPYLALLVLIEVFTGIGRAFIETRFGN